MNNVHRRTLSRIERSGHGRYLTFSCYHRLPLFSNDLIKGAFVDRLAFVKQEMGFNLFAWVVMPEHVHLLIKTGSSDLTLPKILDRLKTRFSRQVIERWRSLDAKILSRITDSDEHAHFWQAGGGYDRNLVSEEEWMEKIEYIHQNPVRRGLVKKVRDWKWPSAIWYAGIKTEGPKIDPLW